jgi:preprotein translocase subunit SecD
MQKNLGLKAAFIIIITLVFLFGIFGVPKGISGSAISASIQDRIHLGLDLKGGTHLILQVMVNDAVNANSDRALETLKEEMRARNIA